MGKKKKNKKLKKERIKVLETSGFDELTFLALKVLSCQALKVWHSGLRLIAHMLKFWKF